MNVNEIISKINNMNLQSEEDLQEVESVLTEMDDALIEPLFRLLERYPHFNFGNPGRIVHYLEKFDNNTYAPLLYATIRRVPTEYNIWMLNRFDEAEKQYKAYNRNSLIGICALVFSGGILAVVYLFFLILAYRNVANLYKALGRSEDETALFNALGVLAYFHLKGRMKEELKGIR